MLTERESIQSYDREYTRPEYDPTHGLGTEELFDLMDGNDSQDLWVKFWLDEGDSIGSSIYGAIGSPESIGKIVRAKFFEWARPRL